MQIAASFVRRGPVSYLNLLVTKIANIINEIAPRAPPLDDSRVSCLVSRRSTLTQLVSATASRRLAPSCFYFLMCASRCVYLYASWCVCVQCAMPSAPTRFLLEPSLFSSQCAARTMTRTHARS